MFRLYRHPENQPLIGCDTLKDLLVKYNGREFLLGEDNEVLLFKSKKLALEYAERLVLKEGWLSVTEEFLEEEYGVYVEEEEDWCQPCEDGTCSELQATEEIE